MRFCRPRLVPAPLTWALHSPGRDLRRFAGVLDPEAAREMIEAIEEGCERVDLDEW
jgi:hypothetical protein